MSLAWTLRWWWDHLLKRETLEEEQVWRVSPWIQFGVCSFEEYWGHCQWHIHVPLAYHWSCLQIVPACEDSLCIFLPEVILWPLEWAWLQDTGSQAWNSSDLMSQEWPSTVRDGNWWMTSSAFLSLYASGLRCLPASVSEGPQGDWAPVANSDNLLVNTLPIGSLPFSVLLPTPLECLLGSPPFKINYLHPNQSVRT